MIIGTSQKLDNEHLASFTIRRRLIDVLFRECFLNAWEKKRLARQWKKLTQEYVELISPDLSYISN